MPVQDCLMGDILGKGGFTQTAGTDHDSVGGRVQELQG